MCAVHECDTYKQACGSSIAFLFLGLLSIVSAIGKLRLMGQIRPTVFFLSIKFYWNTDTLIRLCMDYFVHCFLHYIRAELS